jgi:hypothetical protein
MDGHIIAQVLNLFIGHSPTVGAPEGSNNSWLVCQMFTDAWPMTLEWCAPCRYVQAVDSYYILSIIAVPAAEQLLCSL